MKFKKVISIILTCVILIIQANNVFASTEKFGTALKLSKIIQSYNLSFYDTYSIDDEYECYISKDNKIRLYYDKNRCTLVTDADTLNKLEVIYFVTNSNNGLFGFFPESNLKVHITDLRNELEEKVKDLQIKYAALDFYKGLAYNASTLGEYIQDGEDVLEKRDNLYKSAAKSLFAQIIQSTEQKAIANEKLKQYVNQLIHSTIFVTFIDCIDNLKKAEDYYSNNDIKLYKNAKYIFDKYKFATATFTYAWNYAQKEMIPQINRDASFLGIAGWMMNYALAGSFGLDPALITAGSNNESYPKHEKLKYFIEANKINEDDFANIFEFAENTKNNKLTSEQKIVLELLANIDPYFGEVYYSIINQKENLSTDISRIAFRSVNTVIGGYNTYKQNNWSKNSTNKLIDLGIIKEFAVYPYQESITREDFCNLIYNVYCYFKNGDIEYTDSFVDTDNVNILKLRALGVINGSLANNFCPDNIITREEASVVIGKLLNLIGYNSSSKTINFKDKSKISKWAQDYVGNIANLGVMAGSNGYFMPKKELTYEETFVMCNRIIDLKNSDYTQKFKEVLGKSYNNQTMILGNPNSKENFYGADYTTVGISSEYPGFYTYFDAYTEKVSVISMTSKSNICAFNLQFGMTGEQVKDKLGKPVYEGVDTEAEDGTAFVQNYYVDDYSIYITYEDCFYKKMSCIAIYYTF